MPARIASVVGTPVRMDFFLVKLKFLIKTMKDTSLNYSGDIKLER